MQTVVGPSLQSAKAAYLYGPPIAAAATSPAQIKATERRRARNKAARISRRINRGRA